MGPVLLVFFVTTLLWIVSKLVVQRLTPKGGSGKRSKLVRQSTEQSFDLDRLCKAIALALPECTILPHDDQAYEESMNSYWAQQECEVFPGCVVRPRDTQQLASAIKILKDEYDKRRLKYGRKASGLFAVRGGGHSPVAGAASIQDGVLIDLRHLREVELADDRSYVVIGAGARWIDVSRRLDLVGLAVAGGRNSTVGVGGSILGGGLSFFSPLYGLVCSNIISYEIVLASGTVITVSQKNEPDLWRALKGGSNNFGVVTRFKARCFPSSNIWSGMLYMPSFQASKVLTAFSEFIGRGDSSNNNIFYDKHAAGPIVCFSYVHALGTQAIAVNPVYTGAIEKGEKWPPCWKSSGFPSLWRFWNTCRSRTLTSATDEMNALNPPGRRQLFATTTIKNDMAALTAAHTVYNDAITKLRKSKLKGLVWTLCFQPLLPAWACKGDSNPLGLDERFEEALVVVSLTINWDEDCDDDLIKSTAKWTIDKTEEFAKAKGTSHRYKYINYCAEWQKPFHGYGEKNSHFLQTVSRRYDPDGLFQQGCNGGFKLDMDEYQT